MGALLCAMREIIQIEKPRCSARIDQIRLRLARNLPLDSQNFSSSGSTPRSRPFRAIAILNIGRMDDGMKQQPQCVYKNML